MEAKARALLDAATGYPTDTRLGALGLGWLAGQIPAAP
jgi:hypothetical protein